MDLERTAKSKRSVLWYSVVGHRIRPKSKHVITRPRTRFLVLAIQRFDGSAGSFSSVSE